VRVSLGLDENGMGVLEVADNGRSYDPATVDRKRLGSG